MAKAFDLAVMPWGVPADGVPTGLWQKGAANDTARAEINAIA